jgi:purine-nucleoside phosphorylase
MKQTLTFIHTALPAEAKPIRGKLGLRQITPRLYANDHVLLGVSGMGKEKTQELLEEVFARYTISRAINIGMAGCADTAVPIGTLCCATHALKEALHVTLACVDAPCGAPHEIGATLVDMESAAFCEACAPFLPKEAVYVFKVVSDYGDVTPPSKAFVSGLLQPHIATVLAYA